MSLVRKRERSQPCPDVDCGVLRGLIEKRLVNRGTRNLAGLFRDPRVGITWKTAPRPGLMAKYADLALLLTQKAGARRERSRVRPLVVIAYVLPV